eukprot:COSAG02_NODE_1123_length_14441_cov_28.984521_16_plen_79_part_00
MLKVKAYKAWSPTELREEVILNRQIIPCSCVCNRISNTRWKHNDKQILHINCKPELIMHKRPGTSFSNLTHLYLGQAI